MKGKKNRFYDFGTEEDMTDRQTDRQAGMQAGVRAGGRADGRTDGRTDIFIGINFTVHRLNSSVGRASALRAGSRGFDPGRVIPKTLKMVLAASSLDAQH